MLKLCQTFRVVLCFVCGCEVLNTLVAVQINFFFVYGWKTIMHDSFDIRLFLKQIMY